MPACMHMAYSIAGATALVSGVAVFINDIRWACGHVQAQPVMMRTLATFIS